MVRGDLDPDAWEELMEHCAKARSAEVEESEEEEEAQAPEIKGKEGETKETGTKPDRLTGDPRTQLVASDLEITALDADLPERPRRSLPKPADLPELFLAPAVLTATLDELTWMGKVVLKLQGGVVPNSGTEQYLIEPLRVAAERTLRETREAARACGTRITATALLAIDTRVPIDTVNKLIYTLGYCAFGGFAFAVADPDPERDRLDAPVGGKSSQGNLALTPTGYVWTTDDSETLKAQTATWPNLEALPKDLGESSAPAINLAIGRGAPFGHMAATLDALAGMQNYCVTLILGPEGGAPKTQPPVPAPAPLKIDPRGKVAVHLLSVPAMGCAPELTRLDGSTCANRMKLEVMGDREEREPYDGPGLDGLLSTDGLPDIP
jgi:hypothetical protein